MKYLYNIIVALCITYMLTIICKCDNSTNVVNKINVTFSYSENSNGWCTTYHRNNTWDVTLLKNNKIYTLGGYKVFKVDSIRIWQYYKLDIDSIAWSCDGYFYLGIDSVQIGTLKYKLLK